MPNDTNRNAVKDGQIEMEQLEQHLHGKLAGRVRDLELLRTSEGLVLRGRTSTYHVKQLAQHAIMQVSPLRIAANEIRVL